jgi:hypothetical protein
MLQEGTYFLCSVKVDKICRDFLQFFSQFRIYTEGIGDIWHSWDVKSKSFLLIKDELISIFVDSLATLMLILM